MRKSNSEANLKGLNPFHSLVKSTLCKASAAYLRYHSEYSDLQVRYDVIGIYENGQIKHIENAFYYEV